MADIVQTLGFDASAAIGSLNQLIGALGNFNQALAASAGAIRRFNQGKLGSNLGNVARNLNNVASAANKLVKANTALNNVNNATTKLKRSTDGLLVSWQTLGRITILRGVLGTIDRVQAELSQAVNTAKELGITLAETAAVSPRRGTFSDEVQRLNKEVISASKTFGFDVLDEANARFAEFQNEVKGSAESNDLFISSNKLARISGSEVSDSIEALSSVLNSYNQGVSNSDRVSAALFKTTQLGRIKLDDIADSIGNVTGLASTSGIQFNELGAAIATISRRGISPETTLVQIRGIINQLQKPSTELKKLFTDVFNVSGIEEAIQKFGSFQGVLRAIDQQVGGSSQRLADFFPDIRGRSGFDALSTDAEQFAGFLTEIGDAANKSTGFLDTLLAEFDAQEAVKFQKALNELKLEFLELAQQILPTLTTGLGVLNSALDNIGATISIVSGTALVALAARFLAASAAADILAASTFTAVAGIAGLGLGIGVLIHQLGRMSANAVVAADLAPALQALEKIKLNNIKQINTDSDSAIKGINALVKSGVDGLNKLDEASKQAIQGLRKENDAFVKTTTASLDNLVNSREDIVKALDKQIEGLQERTTKNAEEQTEIRQRIDDQEFQRRIRNMDGLRQAFLETKRATEQLNKSTGNTGTFKGLEDRAKALDRAAELAQEAVSTAQGTGNRGAIFQAEKLLNTILKEQLATKKAQQALDVQATDAAKKKQVDEKAKLDSLKEQVKILSKNLGVFDQGALLSPEQRDQATKNAKQAFDKIKDLALSSDDLKLADILGIADIATRFQETLNGINIDAPKEKLTKQLEEVAKGQTLKIPVEFITGEAKNLGINLGDFDPLRPAQGLQNVLKQTEQKLVENEEAQRKLNTSVQEEQQARGKVIAQLAQIRDNQNEITKGGTQRVPFFDPTAISKIDAFFQNLFKKQFITEEDIAQAEKLVNAFNRVGAGDVPGSNFFTEAAFIRQLIESLKELQAVQKNTVGVEGQLGRAQADEQQLTQLATTIDTAVQKQNALRTGQQAVTTETGKTATKQQETNTKIDQGVGGVNAMKIAYDAAAIAAKKVTDEQIRLNRAQSQGPGPQQPAPRMFGGFMNYLSGGGFPSRGTDTIPAMLSPGEFVVNARSSRKFASQLMAMNAGVPPVYRQDGGSVTHNSVNIGDIKVLGNSDPDSTARAVVSKIKREFRRGTSSGFRKK